MRKHILNGAIILATALIAPAPADTRAAEAKVCVSVSYHCASDYASRSGNGPFCWCKIGSVWFFIERIGDTGSGCNERCPGACGAE
ncbi:MAG: hypothetical protein LBL21_02980 [Rickettsiales bacterium]|jgi:hypothetical protein|nr:hypothetical protein [Rickettsiales bacterium]